MVFPTVIYSPWASMLVMAMSVISLLSLAHIGLSEARGSNFAYSKFRFSKSHKTHVKPIMFSGRLGMFIAYAPASIACVVSFGVYHSGDLRFVLLRSALTLHFLKRISEVFFIHKYSGGMALDSIIPISVIYFLTTTTWIYAQHLTQGFPEPSIDLKYAGIVLFVMGISGNFYHHFLLSKLRVKGEKEYKIPKGGFFDLVICPHYLFEILGFIGFSLISQTLYGFSYTLGIIFNLMGRSYSTRNWYLRKFQDFPKNVRALIPYVF